MTEYGIKNLGFTGIYTGSVGNKNKRDYNISTQYGDAMNKVQQLMSSPEGMQLASQTGLMGYLGQLDKWGQNIYGRANADNQGNTPRDIDLQRFEETIGKIDDVFNRNPDIVSAIGQLPRTRYNTYGQPYGRHLIKRYQDQARERAYESQRNATPESIYQGLMSQYMQRGTTQKLIDQATNPKWSDETRQSAQKMLDMKARQFQRDAQRKYGQYQQQVRMRKESGLKKDMDYVVRGLSNYDRNKEQIELYKQQIEDRKALAESKGDVFNPQNVSGLQGHIDRMTKDNERFEQRARDIYSNSGQEALNTLYGGMPTMKDRAMGVLTDIRDRFVTPYNQQQAQQQQAQQQQPQTNPMMGMFGNNAPVAPPPGSMGQMGIMGLATSNPYAYQQQLGGMMGGLLGQQPMPQTQQGTSPGFGANMNNYSGSTPAFMGRQPMPQTQQGTSMGFGPNMNNYAAYTPAFMGQQMMPYQPNNLGFGG